VRSFGTEGRRKGVNEVPVTDQDISEVTFKIDNIKEFRILEIPKTILLDPAIISTSAR
jgi:hypothetical protein